MRSNKILPLIVSLTILVMNFTINSEPTKKITKIAKEYFQYKQYKELKKTQIIIGDSSKYSWTISLCIRDTYHIQIDSNFMSNADVSKSLHGNKLYRLFIKKYDEYIKNDSIGQPIGQVIVKETWNVKEIKFDSLNTKIQQIKSKNDGKWYTPTTVSELFIMYKEKDNKFNDKGWNYGIYSIENKNEKPILLNNIKISTCINCHKENKYDRVFGVK